MNKIIVEIDLDNYPLLNKIKQDEINSTILSLITIGYNIHFPSIETIKYKSELNDIIKYLDSIRCEIKDNNINYKIESLELSLNKLIGLSSNSYKKGNIGENILEDIFNKKYLDIIYEKKNNIPHSGDAWITLPDNKLIMLESKNYLTTVNKDEINKLEYDMTFNNIKWGILISYNSNIQGMKDFDYHTFTHNKELYSIIMISNFMNDIYKLDLALQVIKKLMPILDKTNNFPWLINNINDNLIELNNIINKNYLLRDNYYIMEKDIQKSLTNYYSILRDYQYDLQHQINKITNQIQSTIDSSLNIDFNNNYQLILNNYKDHKLIQIIERLFDVFKKKIYNIEMKDEINIINNNIIIIKIKIQLKKIIVNIIDNEMTITFTNSKDKQNKTNIEYIEKNI